MEDAPHTPQEEFQKQIRLLACKAAWAERARQVLERLLYKSGRDGPTQADVDELLSEWPE